MFRIKICGIQSVEDALLAAAAGADAIGLNFFAKSPRYVTPDMAEKIVKTLFNDVIKVGLFVNHPPGMVVELFDSLGLDLIQLHGDEQPEYLVTLGGRPVIRAFRLGEAGLQPVFNYLDRCRGLECPPQWALMDACKAGQYGGTGELTDWDCLRAYRSGGRCPPMMLAGGLTPQNVAEAIEVVRPQAVDTASGVESAPGRKDPALVHQFVAAARAAFERAGT